MCNEEETGHKAQNFKLAVPRATKSPQLYKGENAPCSMEVQALCILPYSKDPRATKSTQLYKGENAPCSMEAQAVRILPPSEIQRLASVPLEAV